MSEETTNIQEEDDGSLAFLKIPRDENSRSLPGDEIKQSIAHGSGGRSTATAEIY